jgi:hypothetical protein
MDERSSILDRKDQRDVLERVRSLLAPLAAEASDDTRRLYEAVGDLLDGRLRIQEVSQAVPQAPAVTDLERAVAFFAMAAFAHVRQNGRTLTVEASERFAASIGEVIVNLLRLRGAG